MPPCQFYFKKIISIFVNQSFELLIRAQSIIRIYEVFNEKGKRGIYNEYTSDALSLQIISLRAVPALVLVPCSLWQLLLDSASLTWNSEENWKLEVGSRNFSTNFVCSTDVLLLRYLRNVGTNMEWASHYLERNATIIPIRYVLLYLSQIYSTWIVCYIFSIADSCPVLIV